MPLSSNALDRFIAPKMANLTENNLQELQAQFDQLEHWVSNFISDTIFQMQLPHQVHMYIFNFLRRTQGAFFEYENARLALEHYVILPQKSITLYLKVLFHLEMVLSQSYQAFKLLDKLVTSMGTSINGEIFDNESDLYREKLRKFYNFSKHLDGKIHDNHFPSVSGMPMWLTNNGLEYQKEDSATIWCLSWPELITVLTDLAEAAEFTSKLPYTVRKRLY